MTLRYKLQDKEFVYTAELEPPKGVAMDSFLKKAKLLKGKVDAVNITDNQRAVLRLSSLAASKILFDMDIEPVFQMCCRDRNRIALQSDLLGAHALGIKNVLAISGDYPTLGDQPGAKIVYDVDSVQLLDMITHLNKGMDVREKKLVGNTSFFAGGVVSPAMVPLEPQLIKMKLKAENGAKFFQTQVVYDIETYKQFNESLKEHGINAWILPGILPLRSAKMARFMNESVPGIRIPDEVIHRIETAKNPKKEGLEIAAEMIEKLKPISNGVHIMTVGREETVLDLLEIVK